MKTLEYEAEFCRRQAFLARQTACDPDRDIDNRTFWMERERLWNLLAGAYEYQARVARFVAYHNSRLGDRNGENRRKTDNGNHHRRKFPNRSASAS